MGRAQAGPLCRNIGPRLEAPASADKIWRIHVHSLEVRFEMCAICMQWWELLVRNCRNRYFAPSQALRLILHDKGVLMRKGILITLAAMSSIDHSMIPPTSAVVSPCRPLLSR